MSSGSRSRTRQLDSASLFLHFVHDANEFEAQTRSYYRYALQKVAELNDKEGKACFCLGIILIYPLIGYAASFLTSLPYLKYIKNEVICLLILFIIQVIGYLFYLFIIVHRETNSMKKWIAESQQTPDLNFRSDQILEQLAHERRIKVALYAKNLGDVYYAERCAVVSIAAFLVVTFIGSILLLFSQTFWALFWLFFAGSSNLAWGRYKLRETNFGLPPPPEMHREDITKHLVSAQRSWQCAITDGSENQRRTTSGGNLAGPIINEMDE